MTTFAIDLIMQVLQKTTQYLSLVKFSHTVFALPFAAIGFSLAISQNGLPVFWPLAIKVLVCMVTARNAAMAFNRWADRNIDALNPRTALREIPAGIIKANRALWFVIINALLFTVTAYLINNLCFYLSPVALFVVLGYSFTKRFTALCHLVLGAGLALAPVGAYLAVTGRFDIVPILIGVAVLCWVSGFDIIYALQDEQFDRENKLHSIPSLMGKKHALQVSRILHFLTAGFLALFLYQAHIGLLAWSGLAVFCALLIYQHSLVSENNLSKVNIAFATTNGIASIVFAGMVITDIFLLN